MKLKSKYLLNLNENWIYKLLIVMKFKSVEFNLINIRLNSC